jgi:hypothetical protein
MKLAEQVKRFGGSIIGMPPILVTRGANGEMMINDDGVTRATRAHRFASGVLVPVEVLEDRPTIDLSKLPLVRER